MASAATFTTSSQGMEAYAAPSLFQPHRARQAIRDAHQKKIRPLLCYYAGLASLPITRYLAPMKYDAVWIDWAHSACNVETMTNMVHEAIFMSQGATIPFVRVPGHDHAAIGYALDAGASIIVPQVDTVEQAQQVVSSAKFGSKQRGTRSVAPFRLVPGITDQALDGTRDIHKNVNDQAAIMIQIESLKGINNLDAILTQVPDIDIVWLGSLDARVSMNLPASIPDQEEKEWIEAKEKFYSIAAKHDKPCGGFSFVAPGFGKPEALKEAAKRLSFITCSADVVHLAGLEDDLQKAKELISNV